MQSVVQEENKCDADLPVIDERGPSSSGGMQSCTAYLCPKFVSDCGYFDYFMVTLKANSPVAFHPHIFLVSSVFD